MFKYYKIPCVEIIEKIIGANPSIKFSSSKDLNDPFELKFNLIINPISENSKEFFFELNPNKKLKDFKKWQDNINNNSIWEIAQKLREKFTETYSLTCFSESKDNNLMWSHYTDNHKGICVEYSDDIYGFFKLEEKFFASKKVDYSKDIPLVYLDENVQLQIEKIFFNKQLEWSYESEYRVLFRSTEETQFIKINPKFIKSIYIGSKCKVDISNKIVEICNDNEIKVFYANTKSKSYKIEFLNYKT